ncbi:SPW repeat protein [Nonomuraea sp. NPDC050536]|uniref:SPW repeat protein n=1 Tax=Nonomuraea sp. NPDC050536 TaxID=3364366 RepID=UPI0037CBB681
MRGRLTKRPASQRLWRRFIVKAWSRWQDWATLVTGLYAALSPIWVDGASGATPTLIDLSALTAITSLASLSNPGTVATEWLNALWGVLPFVAPWVITYTDGRDASWTSWVVDVVPVPLSLTALPSAEQHTSRRSNLSAIPIPRGRTTPSPAPPLLTFALALARTSTRAITVQGRSPCGGTATPHRMHRTTCPSTVLTTPVTPDAHLL